MLDGPPVSGVQFGVQSDKALSEVRATSGGIRSHFAITHHHKYVSAPIGDRATACLPEAASPAVGGGVEYPGKVQCRGIVGEHPAMVEVMVAVTAEGHIHALVSQQ